MTAMLALFAADAMAGVPATLPNAVAPTVLPSADRSLTWSLHERVRGEWRENNFDFDDETDSLTDDAWLLQRFRLSAEWRINPSLRFFAEGQDTREFFSDRPDTIGLLGAEGDDAFDLRQGYFELGDPERLSLRVGRTTMVYGDKRLISSGEWGNPSRTFDAVRLHYQRPSWWLDAFAASVVRLRDGEFNRSAWLSESDTLSERFSGLFGLYFSTTAIDVQVTDAYALALHENGTDFVTIGTRMKGDPEKLSGWDYAAEMAAQFGELQNTELAAFAGHWDIGYNWLQSPWKPRIGVEYSFASGDSNAADRNTGTFQNLYPTNHLYYGYMDLFAWQNVHNPAVHFSMQPHEKVKLSADFHAFWLANTSDSWYRSNIASTVRPVAPGADSFAGTELDLTLLWKAHEHLEVQAGYSRFFAGSYLADTGAADDADFAYLMLTVTF